MIRLQVSDSRFPGYEILRVCVDCEVEDMIVTRVQPKIECTRNWIEQHGCRSDLGNERLTPNELSFRRGRL